MPANIVNLLFRFLRQGDGFLSQRALAGEFAELQKEEVEQVENLYREIFVLKKNQ